VISILCGGDEVPLSITCLDSINRGIREKKSTANFGKVGGGLYVVVSSCCRRLGESYQRAVHEFMAGSKPIHSSLSRDLDPFFLLIRFGQSAPSPPRWWVVSRHCYPLLPSPLRHRPLACPRLRCMGRESPILILFTHRMTTALLVRQWMLSRSVQREKQPGVG